MKGKAKISCIIFMYMCAVFSCSMFDFLDDYVDSVNFESPNLSVQKGGMVACILNCSPEDCFSYYDAVFTLSDETVAKIIKQDESSCVITGLKEGYTILNARVGNKETYCIINVV